MRPSPDPSILWQIVMGTSGKLTSHDVGKVLINQTAVGERLFALQFCRIKRKRDCFGTTTADIDPRLYDVDNDIGLFTGAKIILALQ